MADLSRITLDVEVCHGKPCVRHMRWPVEVVLDLVGAGMTMDEIIVDHPGNRSVTWPDARSLRRSHPV